jgi:hypothetical protein
VTQLRNSWLSPKLLAAETDADSAAVTAALAVAVENVVALVAVVGMTAVVVATDQDAKLKWNTSKYLKRILVREREPGLFTLLTAMSKHRSFYQLVRKAQLKLSRAKKLSFGVQVWCSLTPTIYGNDLVTP